MAKTKPIQPIKRVVGYVRVSSVQQVNDGESLERQEEQIRDYCHRKELPEPEMIVDAGKSGFKDSRPGFQKLVQLCRSKAVSTVVVYDLSRLSRSVRATLNFIELDIAPNGIDFVALKNDVDTSTAMGKAFLTISAVFNQLYRDSIAEKTRAAFEHKRSKGEKTGGTVPYGHDVTGDGQLVTNHIEANVVDQILTMRGAGMTYRSIAARLTEKLIPTKTGKPAWDARVIWDIVRRSQQRDPERLSSKSSNKSCEPLS
jgi:site-specific DNA recombinase